MRLRRPSVFAVALTLFGIAIFCALGVWQLRRAAYKEAVLARFHHAATAPLTTLGDAVADRLSGDYPHVEVSGHLEGDRVYFLDDQMRAGRLGVMVFVPFVPAGSARVLLANLGFLSKMGPDSTQLPDLPPIPSGRVTLTGIYAPPPLTGMRLGGNPLGREKTWPKLVTWIDTHQIGADLHAQVYPHVLLLDPDAHSAYIRSWTANVMPPARHEAYALQWFTFALAAIALFFVIHRVKPADATTPPED
ncbi:MAG TPA: SURF1 family protein [Rhodanobacteraceae bacterium]|nr:SURF1 family protein [Rhodanobacteraceae bacterium]